MIDRGDGDVAAGSDSSAEKRRDDKLQNTLSHPVSSALLSTAIGEVAPISATDCYQSLHTIAIRHGAATIE
jgi:hypothetical protein